jgi:uncharacterized membrane protein
VAEVSYEYLYERVERLRERPFRAEEVMRRLNEAGVYPIAVRVDNDRGQVVAYFAAELGRKEKAALDEAMKRIFREW